jgi:ribosomal protein S7
MKTIKNIFIQKDYLYDNGLIRKFTNSIYYKGHKQKNKKLVIKLLGELKETNQKAPLKVIILTAIMGKMLITTIRVKLAGRSHNIASPMSFDKQYLRFLKIFTSVLKRKQKGDRRSIVVLKEEINNIINEKRGATEIRNDQIHEIAIEDFSYLHYRWR